MAGSEIGAARAPGVAANEYVLTNPKAIKGTLPPARTSGTVMYEVEGISAGQLKQHAGHRVQIDGVFENLDHTELPPREPASQNEPAELHGTEIRHVATDCGEKPTTR